jgi:DNA-3-methyladenine glycosylase I
MIKRCDWCGDEPIYVDYHDTEWGMPEYDGRALWEKLVLDGFQAGLSWITILKKRDAFREAFQGFNPEIVARFTEEDVERLLQNAGIIRHRGKINAAIKGAKAVLDMGGADKFGEYCWSWVDGKPFQNRCLTDVDRPAYTDLSTAFSKDLKKRGFNFCGPTIVYAWMQACGLVNDHMVECHCYEKAQRAAR